MSLLEELEASVQRAIERTGPAVVGIGQRMGKGIRVRARARAAC